MNNGIGEGEVEVMVREGAPASPATPLGVAGAKNDQRPLEGESFWQKGGGSRIGPLRVCGGEGSVSLSGSLPSESGGGREPGSMSFPCGTISASRELPFPGDFYREGEECPLITLRPAGLGGGTGFSG